MTVQHRSRGAVMALAPLRVSLAGGGTDLPSYHLGRGGRVLSLAIDRYVCVNTFERSFDGSITTRFDTVGVAHEREAVDHPIMQVALSRLGRKAALQVASHADAPSGSGLGSSGAFSVALLHALGDGATDDASLNRLAVLASDLEMVDLQRSVGRHDHYMAAFGGLRDLRIAADGTIEPVALPVSPAVRAFVRDRLLLFFVGGTRDASAALSVQDDRTRSGDRNVIGALDTIHELAHEAAQLLEAGEVDGIGMLLDRHWQHKRKLSSRVSSMAIDELYATARAAGASGGKLLGAGGGGFLLLCTQDEGGSAAVRGRMTAVGARELPFALDSEGVRSTRIAFT